MTVYLIRWFSLSVHIEQSNSRKRKCVEDYVASQTPVDKSAI